MFQLFSPGTWTIFFVPFQVKRVRSASSTLGPPGASNKEDLVVLDDTKNQHYHSSQWQMQLQEEENDLQALAERERAIRQLEVCHQYFRLPSLFQINSFTP